jgi:14-3-3 protein epsilon
LCEILIENELQESKEECIKAYQKSSDISKDFSDFNPIKLSTALNFSIFYYDIMNSPETASKIAKFAFDSAISRIENVTDEDYKETTQILQLLKEKLTFWSSENEIKEEEYSYEQE